MMKCLSVASTFLLLTIFKTKYSYVLKLKKKMYFCPEPFGPPLSAAAVTNLTLEVIYLLLLFF